MRKDGLAVDRRKTGEDEEALFERDDEGCGHLLASDCEEGEEEDTAAVQACFRCVDAAGGFIRKGFSLSPPPPIRNRLGLSAARSSRPSRSGDACSRCTRTPCVTAPASLAAWRASSAADAAHMWVTHTIQ